MSLPSAMQSIARAVYRTASSRGGSGVYYHDNSSGINVYFIWGGSNINGDASMGFSNGIEESRMTIANAGTMSGVDPRIGDVILTNNQYWVVTAVVKLGLPSLPCAWQLSVRREDEALRTHG